MHKDSKGLSDAEFREIDLARLKNKKLQNGLFMNLEDLRFATNNLVAKYRAKRLACDNLVEIGCSIGAQTLEFAKTCKRVKAVDVNERKLKYAKMNLAKFNANNVELICEDGIKLDLKKADIIFCDPEREPESKKRDLSEFKPDIYKLIEKYSDVTKNFCIEIPPQTRKIDIDCEKEYVSVKGQLNRLNLYFGDLKTSESSAVVLPSESRLEGKPGVTQLTSTNAKKFLYEVDGAVLKAELVDALAGLLEEEVTLFKDDYKFLTSDKKIESLFFKNIFEVISATNKTEVVEELKKHKCGKVILRQTIDPKEYWAERKKYEDQLTGEKIVHLIVTETTCLICEKLFPDLKRS